MDGFCSSGPRWPEHSSKPTAYHSALFLPIGHQLAQQLVAGDFNDQDLRENDVNIDVSAMKDVLNVACYELLHKLVSIRQKVGRTFRFGIGWVLWTARVA